MNIVYVKTRKDKKRYIDFIYKIYKNDNEYCNLNITFVKNFLYKKDSYAMRTTVKPIIIEDNNEIKLVCMFVYNENDKEIKLSFIEFLPNSQKYLLKLKELCLEELKLTDKKKAVIGINGQISYGLGILVHKNKKEKYEFNANYNPDYYTKELDEVFEIKKRAFSYTYNGEHSLELFDKKMLQNIYENYTIRKMNKKKFKQEMLIFGDLCDKTLRYTPYYSDKTPKEMYELMKQMKFLMKNEDILFAMKDGKEIGYIFTHPDYAELFEKPKLSYIKLFFKIMKNEKPKNLIYNVIGVLPEHQKSGIAVALICQSLKDKMEEYPNGYGVSSFILEENVLSTALCKKFSVGINKEYRLYEIEG